MTNTNDDFKLDYMFRIVKINPDDYKDNKKHMLIIDFLQKSKLYRYGGGILSELNRDNDRNNITEEDISIFLQNKKIQKNGITRDDVIDFLKKVQKLNPSFEEQHENELTEQYKDENGNSVMTPEIKEMFGLKYNDVKIRDEHNNVKKGFEVFDLNEDGKIDKYENEAISELYGKLDNLEEYLTEIDKGGNNEAKADGVISKQDKLSLYKKKLAVESKALYKTLNSMDIKDEQGKDVITPDIKELFNNKVEITYDDVIDENGNIKSGMEIFDLNGDKKLDDYEKAYFSSGGHPLADDIKTLKLENFINAVTMLDKFGYDAGYDGGVKDKKIPDKDKSRLYKMIGAAHYMLDNIDSLPEELQKQYTEVLKSIHFEDYQHKYNVGLSKNDSTINMNSDIAGLPELASTLIHELTHSVLSEKGMKPLLQEVEAYYMEYKFYKNAKSNDSDYFKKYAHVDIGGAEHDIVNIAYMDYVDNLKNEHPELSELDIAVEAFLKFYFDSYNGHYTKSFSPDYMKNQKYDSLYGIFEDNDGHIGL